MKMSYAGKALVTLAIAGSLASADDSSQNSENLLAAIRKICVSQKKSPPMCGCVVKNLNEKFRNGHLSDQQLRDALTVSKKYTPPAEEANRLDYMADLITGLEYHCVENSNYSGD